MVDLVRAGLLGLRRPDRVSGPLAPLVDACSSAKLQGRILVRTSSTEINVGGSTLV